jgi:hypothetical protein
MKLGNNGTNEPLRERTPGVSFLYCDDVLCVLVAPAMAIDSYQGEVSHFGTPEPVVEKV